MLRLQIILWVASFWSTSRGENTGANDKENYFPKLGISENNCQGQCWEAERTRGRSLFFISDNLVLIFPTVDMKWWPCSLSSVPHFTNEISFLVKKCRNYPSARGGVRNVETRRREELLSSSDVGSERGRVVSCLLADSELEVSCWPVFRLLTPTQHHVSPRAESWELHLQSWLRIMYKFLPLKWRDISYEKWNRSQLLFVVTSERSSGYWWWMLLVTMQYDWLVVHNQHLKWCFVIFAHRSLECWLPGISFLVVPRKR